jgi:hypothetical protein
MLTIDQTNGAFDTAARAALNTLVGNVANALSFVQKDSKVWGRWIEVQKGTAWATAQAARPHGTTLVGAVIDQPLLARIVPAVTGNETTPECTPFAYMATTDVFRTQAQAQSRAVTGPGASCRIHWTAAPEETANLAGARGGPQGYIEMGPCPDYICLAHELIHAERCGRGIVAAQRIDNLFILIDSRPAKDYTNWIASFRAVGTGQPARVYHDTNTDEWYDKVSEMVEEIITVGMPLPADPNYRPQIPPHPLGVSENDIRNENNVLIRLKYGDYFEAKTSCPNTRRVGAQ